MAKMYYSIEEAQQKLGCNEEQLRGLVRSGKLREFRDAGKPNYKVDDVDKLVDEQSNLGLGGSSSGELSLADSGEISLLPDDSGSAMGIKLESSDAPAAKTRSGSTGPSGSDAPIDLSGTSGAGELRLEGSGELRLSDSSAAPASKPAKPSAGSSTGLKLDGSGAGELKLEDSSASKPAPAAKAKSRPPKDEMSLDEVDKDQLQGMKKDDTVITNIGISVFDDDDLEIAADPMAKTMLTTGGEDHLGLDGSGGGSGLLDLTRESDDTSLGAELLEGIDMGDTAENVSPAAAAAVTPENQEEDSLPEPSLEPILPTMGPRALSVQYVEAASPAFTGLLVAASIALVLLGATVVATSMGAWPGFLGTLAGEVDAGRFWILIGGMLGLGLIGAGIGHVTTMKSSGPKAPKPPKEPKAKKEKAKKGKKGDAIPALPGE